MPFAMLPYHHMLMTEARFAEERRNRKLEHRRLLWEARWREQEDGRASRSRSLAAVWRALVALVGDLVRTERRSPVTLPASADWDLRA